MAGLFPVANMNGNGMQGSELFDSNAQGPVACVEVPEKQCPAVAMSATVSAVVTTENSFTPAGGSPALRTGPFGPAMPVAQFSGYVQLNNPPTARPVIPKLYLKLGVWTPASPLIAASQNGLPDIDVQNGDPNFASTIERDHPDRHSLNFHNGPNKFTLLGTAVVALSANWKLPNNKGTFSFGVGARLAYLGLNVSGMFGASLGTIGAVGPGEEGVFRLRAQAVGISPSLEAVYSYGPVSAGVLWHRGFYSGQNLWNLSGKMWASLPRNRLLENASLAGDPSQGYSAEVDMNLPDELSVGASVRLPLPSKLRVELHGAGAYLNWTTTGDISVKTKLRIENVLGVDRVDVEQLTLPTYYKKNGLSFSLGARVTMPPLNVGKKTLTLSVSGGVSFENYIVDQSKAGLISYNDSGNGLKISGGVGIQAELDRWTLGISFANLQRSNRYTVPNGDRGAIQIFKTDAPSRAVNAGDYAFSGFTPTFMLGCNR